MSAESMMVTAWNNGSYHRTGAGYGIRIKLSDRNKFFNRTWTVVKLQLQGIPGYTDINPKRKTFWNNSCPELFSQEIGKWLIGNRINQWPKGHPPEMVMTKIRGNQFKIILLG